MKSEYIQYLKKLLIYTVIIAVVAFVLAYFLPDNYSSPSLAFLLVFFMAVSLLTHYFVLKTMAKRMSLFVNFYMISIFVKLFLYVAIIVIYSLMNRDDVIPFVITFFTFYLLYTIFELVAVLKLQNKQEKPD